MLFRSIVRVRVTLPAGRETLLDDLAIRRALVSVHYMAGVSREVEGAQRSRLANVRTAEGIGPSKALDLYFESKGVQGERLQVLAKYGRDLVAEVDAGAEAVETVSGEAVPLGGLAE